MTSQYGRITSCSVVTEQATLIADATAGTHTLLIGDPESLEESGWLLVNNDPDVAGSGQVVAYTLADDGTITLASPLASNAATDDPVTAYDLATGSTVYKQVKYQIDGDDDGADEATANVRHDLWDKIAEGVRDGLGERIRVSEDPDTGEHYVNEVIGTAPVIDASYVDPTTIPDPVPVDPPAVSPALTVYGSPTSLVVRAEEIAPTTLIEYHISTTDGFTPDSTTLWGDPTRSTVVVIGTLPDGTSLVDGTTYYLRAVATNVAGDAAPSAQTIGALDTSAISTLVAAQLVAGFILAGKIQVGGITIDPVNGIKIPQPNGQFIIFPVDGSRAGIHGAGVDADSLNVTGSSVLADTVFTGAVSFATGVQPPAAPTVAPALQSVTPATALNNPKGLTENSGTPGAGTTWVTAWMPSFTLTVVEIDKSTGAVTSHTPGPSPGIGVGIVYGIVRLGSYYYVASNDGAGLVTVRKLDTSFAVVSQWNYTGTVPTTFGTDGTNLLFAYPRASDSKPVIRTFTTAGVQVGSDLVTNTTMMAVRGIHGTPADFGATRFVLLGAVGTGTNGIRVYDSAGNRQSGDEWTPAGTDYGIYWDGTRFHEISGSTGAVSHFANHATTETVSTDSTLTDTSVETAAGAAVSVSWPKRWWLSVQVAAYPAAPTGLLGKVYVGGVWTVTNKALTSNVATLTIGTHRLAVGETVEVSGVDSTFNGTYVVTAVTASTFSYARTHANVTSAAATGTAIGQRRLQTLSPALSTSNQSGYIDTLNTGSSVAPTTPTGAFGAGGVGSMPGLTDARTAYTPTLSASTPPNVGSTGSVTGRYRQVGKGDVDFEVYIVFGGTGISGGSGVWTVTLPVAEKAAHLMFTGVYRDSSGTVSYGVFAEKVSASQTVNLKTSPDPAGTAASLRNITATVPKAPASGDYLFISGRYEPA